MSNKPFQFKKFVLNHKQTPMKIGVDGVLLGAWAHKNNPINILDIGAGCGLIGFMLQQKHPEATVELIEPNTLAYNELVENISINKFNNIIHHNITLQDFKSKSKFDLIACNPPFYKEDNLLDLNRAQARQQKYLPIKTLFQSVNKLISQEGTFSIIYPSVYYHEIISEANLNDLFLTRKTNIFANDNALCKRHLLEFKRIKKKVLENNLIIELSRNIYHPDYIALTKDFYLNF